MARRRFFVESVHRGHAQVSGGEAHHLTRVLRVEPGQKYEISDNRCVYLAEVETARKDFVSFSILEPLETPEPALRAAVFAALIKFEHFEWMIEKTTELGVERIVPVQTARTEKGLAGAAPKRMVRWNRIAREASEQSRRARLPEIGEPCSLAEALRAGTAYRYALEESGAAAILNVLPAERHPGDEVALLVGPEGGWTDRERSEIAASQWTAVSLGPHILRAETAALAALAILAAAWDAAK